MIVHRGIERRRARSPLRTPWLRAGPTMSAAVGPTIAVLPHDDQLGLAVADRHGFPQPGQHRRCPLPATGVRTRLPGRRHQHLGRHRPVSPRTQPRRLDRMGRHGQLRPAMPMRGDPSRIGRLVTGDIDAVFEEGAILWADAGGVKAADRRPALQLPEAELLLRCDLKVALPVACRPTCQPSTTAAGPSSAAKCTPPRTTSGTSALPVALAPLTHMVSEATSTLRHPPAPQAETF